MEFLGAEAEDASDKEPAGVFVAVGGNALPWSEGWTAERAGAVGGKLTRFALVRVA